MRIRFRSLALVAALFPAVVASQPSLSSLWPNADGMRWDYGITVVDIVQPMNWSGDATMRFEGTVETSGGTAQVLIASHPIPVGKLRTHGGNALLAAVWRARPDLRAALEARYGDHVASDDAWFPILLHEGYFQKNTAALQMWQPDFPGHPTWTFVTSDLTVGSRFTQQLIPEITDDVFLHGTVESIDATVTTPAATFEHAVRMGYRIDYGLSEATGEDGTPLGQFFRSETLGHVHFVPDKGPVQMHEEFIPLEEIDCGTEDCPSEWTDLLGVSVQIIDMALTGTTVSVRETTFTQIKALYR